LSWNQKALIREVFDAKVDGEGLANVRECLDNFSTGLENLGWKIKSENLPEFNATLTCHDNDRTFEFRPQKGSFKRGGKTANILHMCSLFHA
jgi:hypothetical protein